MSQRQGLIQIYTGDGKGKTTASLGQAFRAAGRGFRVRMFQFMKPPESSGEHFAVAKFDGDLIIEPVGRRKWIGKSGPDEEDIRLARSGLARAKAAMIEGGADMVILDEVDVALHFEVLTLDEVMDMIRSKPGHVELILTGRKAAPEILDMADLVTEMKLIKHPYEQGVLAREGIEF